MATTVPITGLSANNPQPGVYVEVAFAQGASAGGTSTYAILILANKLAAGSATPDTVIYGPDTTPSLSTAADSSALFASGSEADIMWRRVQSVNANTTPIYVVCVAESAGLQASLAITFTGTATANGTGRVFLGDTSVDFGITNGDLVATIAASAATAVNAKPGLAMTASSALGVLTITSRQKGLRGNWLRAGAIIVGAGIGTTVSGAATQYLAGGTVADSFTNALATINPKRFYYIISADDGGQASANLPALCSQVTTQALPTNGIRQIVVAGATDTTVANVTTTAIALNTPRCELYHYPGGDLAPCELAALIGGASAAYEVAHASGTLNFDYFGQSGASAALWKLLPQRTGASFTNIQIQAALNNGVSPIGVASGKPYLVSRITTKSQTAGVADYRIRDAHKVRVCDWFADDSSASATQRLLGKTIANDPPSAAVKPPPGAATPSLLKSLVVQFIDQYDANGLLQNAADIRAAVFPLRETSPTTRLSVSVPLQPIDVLHQVGMFIAQVA